MVSLEPAVFSTKVAAPPHCCAGGPGAMNTTWNVQDWLGVSVKPDVVPLVFVTVAGVPQVLLTSENFSFDNWMFVFTRFAVPTFVSVTTGPGFPVNPTGTL